MHSEERGDVRLAYDTFEAEQKAAELGDSSQLSKLFAGFKAFAGAHLDPIQRYGRYPHRNRVLGRQSTPDEAHYIESSADPD